MWFYLPCDSEGFPCEESKINSLIELVKPSYLILVHLQHQIFS